MMFVGHPVKTLLNYQREKASTFISGNIKKQTARHCGKPAAWVSAPATLHTSIHTPHASLPTLTLHPPLLTLHPHPKTLTLYPSAPTAHPPSSNSHLSPPHPHCAPLTQHWAPRVPHLHPAPLPLIPQPQFPLCTPPTPHRPCPAPPGAHPQPLLRASRRRSQCSCSAPWRHRPGAGSGVFRLSKLLAGRRHRFCGAAARLHAAPGEPAAGIPRFSPLDTICV